MSFWNWRFPRKKSSRSAQAKQRRQQRPRLFRALGELLEQRNLLAVRIWDGLPDVSGVSANNQWSTPTNWVGDIAPIAGDDLVFPISASLKTNINDFDPGTLFNSIQFAGSGYDISGNSIQLLGGLAATNATGSNELTTPITLLNAETFVSGNAGTTLALGDIDTANLVGTTGVLGTSALTVDGAGDLEIGGVLSGQGSLYKQGSGTLFLTQDNTYAGLTTVQQGAINVSSNLALGSTAAGTTVTQGAALQVQGGITVGEPLSIAEAGVGFGDGVDTTHPVGLGALRSISGDNTWTGGIELAGGNNLIGVDAGSLDISSIIGSSQLTVRNLYKVGAGTLQFSGTESNTFTGTMTLLQGTLELNKRATPGDPSTGIVAFQGSLTIGDHIGGDNAAVVRLLADNQIPQLDYFNTTITTVTVNSSGVLDLNNRSDVVGNINIFEGATYSGDIMTGAGVLTLGGASLTLSAFQGSSPASTAATITGKLDLGSFLSAASGGVTKTFAINNSALQNVDEDLVISADISGAANVSLTKTGAGVMTLSGNNTYHGPTILAGGIVRIGSDTAFGDGLLSIQNSGLVLRALGGARTVTNTVSLDSNFSVRGSNDLTFTGPATLTGSRTIFVLDPTETTTFSGGIGEGIFGSLNIGKSGEGTLALTGTNTYSGSTTVNSDGGTLLLKDGGTLLNTTTITVSDGGTFTIDNSGTNLTNRINDQTFLTMSGGDFNFIGANGAASSETVGLVTLTGNTSSTIRMTPGTGVGSSANFTGNSLAVGAGSTVEFVGEGAALSDTGSNRISFAISPPTPGNGILPYARVVDPLGNIDFATIASTADGFTIVPLPSTAYTTDINQAGPTSNVRLGAGVHTLTISRTINSLILDPGAILNGPGATLTVSTGGVMFTGGATSAINVETLNLGSQGLLVVQGDASTAAINSTIVGAATSITKAGAGKLIFTGDNQYGGGTNINGGVLNIQRSNALGGTAGSTVVRQGAALEIQETTFGPVNVSIETVTIVGTGVNGAGALRNISGSNNSWAGAVVLSAVSIDEAVLFPSTNVIVASVATIGVDAGRLNISGQISGGSELIKVGAGTLETSGVLANTYSGSTRIKEGTLLLNKVPGASAIVASPLFVGDDDGVGAPGVLQLGGSDQIFDGVTVQVGSTGQVDFNGFNDAITGLVLTIGPNGASSVDLGSGTLTIASGTNNANVIIVQQIGSGNPTGATISNGTLALALFGTTGALNRNFQVNDGATGDDLTITATIVDGSSIPVPGFGITKTGFGTLVFGGNSANTYTGTTTVSEGTLALDKGTGSGGVNALGGALTIGDANVQSGFARSDVVQLRQPNQIPDWVALVTVQITGLLDLNGFDETIGNTDGQTALQLNCGNVTTGAGTLSINGNIAFVAGTGATLFTPIVAPTISGNLNLGSISRIFDIQDQGALAIDAVISANISSTGAGLVKNNNGFLLLSGNNTYSGNTFVNSGTNGIAVGSDSALGTGSVSFLGSSAGIMAFGDARTVSNALYLPNARTQFGYWNDITFTGPANGVNGTITATTVNAVGVEFAGGIGETIGGTALTKEGVGKLILSGVNTYSGNTTVNTNSGIIVLRGQGTALNSNTFTVNAGGNLEIDNASGANLSNRIGDSAAITLTGGTLAVLGKAGAATAEVIGTITLSNNTASTIQTQTSSVPGSSLLLTSTSLSRGTQSYVNFQGFGSDLGSSTNQLAFVAAPTLTGSAGNQILPFATIRSATGQIDLATHSGNNTSIAAFTNYSIGDINSATPGTNYLLTSNQTLTADLALNAILIRGTGLTLDGDNPARTLTLGASGGAALVDVGTGNLVSVPTITLAAEGLVRTIGDLEIQSNIAGGQALTTSGSGVLKLSGSSASTYTGATVITEGTVVAQKDTAFGTTAGGVVVAFGATLGLSGGINVGAETLNVQGTGAATTVSTIGLRSISGNNTWAGNVTLATNPTGVQVDADSLNLSGVLSGAVGLNKLGEGTLQYSGSVSNTYSSTTVIYQGTLLLNKTGANALAAAVIVGDYVPGAGPDQLVLGQSDQIVNAATITVNGTGLFDLNGNAETLAPAASGTILTINIGPTASGEVRIGTGTLTLGTATFQGNVAVGNITGGSPVPATISSTTGSLVLPTSASAAGTVFTLNDTASPEDLRVTANISGPSGFTKAGNGRMVLSGNNTYSGITTVSTGRLNLQSDTALGVGGGSTASGTVVSSGAVLQLTGGRTITSETLNLNSTGIAATGALRSLDGVNTWTGNITLAGNTNIGVDADQLILSGAISSTGAFGVTKILPGTLVYSGLDVPNTYSGNTAVIEGTLELNKTSSGPAANLVAIASPIIDVGNDAGGANADVVRFDNDQQFSGAVRAIIHTSGLLDLNGNNQTITGPQFSTHLMNGVTFSGRLDTGAGTWTLGGAPTTDVVTTQVGAIPFTTSSPSAVIAGNLDLGAGIRTFRTDKAGLTLNELDVQAIVIGTGGISKVVNGGGTGTLLLSNNNSYGGGTLLNGGAGTIAVSQSLITDTPLGAGTISTVSGTAPVLRAFGGPVTLNNNIAMPGSLTIGGDQNLTLNGLITQTGNTTLTVTANNSATVNFAGGINLGGGTMTLAINTFNATETISGQIVDGAGTGAITKTGNGTLVLSTANTYSGITTISAGILAISDSNALGSAAGGTASGTVISANNAALQVSGGINVADTLSMNANARGFFTISGALRSTSGANTWSGNIILGNANSQFDGIGVDADRLTITGQISQSIASVGLIKMGQGALQLAGSVNNTYAGSTLVWAGTLELNMTPGANAFGGGLNIGDEAGGANADQVVLMANDQIPTSTTATVLGSGLLDLGTFNVSDAIGTLTLNRGYKVSANVATGTGTLYLGGTLTVSQFGFSDGTSPAATISGNLGLFAPGAASQTRTITVNDSLIPDAGDDLVISAVIDDGDGNANTQAISSTGFGTLVFTAANTYSGATTVSASTFAGSSITQQSGTLILRDAGTFSTSAGTVTVNAGATLVLDNTNTSANRITDAAPLTLAGGTLSFIGNGTTGTTENIGTLTVNPGTSFGSTIQSTTNGGMLAQLIATGLGRGAGGTLNLVGVNDDLGSATNVVSFTGGTNPFVNGVIPWATMQGPAGYDLVTDGDGDPTTAPFVMSRFTNYANDINATGNAVVKLDGSEPAANRILSASNTIAALLLENGVAVTEDGLGPYTLTMGTATAGLIVSHSGSNSLAAGTLAFSNREPLLLVDDGSSLTVSSSITGTAALRKERPGALTFTGDNSGFTGGITVNQGQLTAQNNNAFGSTAGGVTVNNLALLTLDGGFTIGNEAFAINGTGLNNDGTGALKVINGDATIGTGATTFTLNGTTAISVDAASTLTLDMNVTGTQTLIKLGGGTLEFAGGTTNASTGARIVNEGTLRLNKTGAALAVQGTLTVGDFAGADAVVYGSLAGTNQIGNVALNVNSGALLDLNGISDTINGTLTMAGGTVDTGAGTLTLGANIVYNYGSPATISGNLDLGGAVRTIAVSDGAAADDLVINAIISNGGITKTNVAGTLLLDPVGMNTFGLGTTLQGGTMSLGRGDALGTGSLTLNTASSTIRAKDGVHLSGANSIANEIVNNMPNGGILSLGGRRDFGGTGDVELSGPMTLQAPGAAATNSFNVDDPLVKAEISGIIGGGGSNLTVAKTGNGRLIVSGNNTFATLAASFRIDAGILNLRNSNALGSGTTGVNVNVGANPSLGALELEDAGGGPVNITGRTLFLPAPSNLSSGYLNNFSGSLLNVAGDNSWSGTVDIRSTDTTARNGFIGVASGSLNLSGVVQGTTNAANPLANNLFKVGAGTLIYSGAAANTLTGTTFVMDGVLNLNKAGVGNPVAINGPLFIGDNVGADSSAQVVYGDAAVNFSNNQILDTAAITINTDGLLDLGTNVRTDTIGTLTLISGDTSAHIQTGTGTVTLLGNNVTVNVRPGVTAGAPVTIDGNLALNATAAGQRTFTVADGAGAVELLITANISDGAFASGIIKSGAGRMFLQPAGTSTFTGAVTVSAGGQLMIQGDSALGASTSGTTVSSGGVLELTGGFTKTGGTLTLSGNGVINGPTSAVATAVLGTGALRSVSGDNVWTGNVTIGATNTSIDTSGGNLDLQGVVNFGNNFNTIKTGSGTLTLSGGASNTFTTTRGTFWVDQGTVLLDKTGAFIAVPVNLVIGDNLGGNNADRVVYGPNAGTDQIDNVATVTVSSTGLLDLATNNKSDTVNGNTILNVGPTSSGNIQTGTGTYTVGTTIFEISQAGTTTASPAATIAGNLSLGGATRSFDVRSAGLAPIGLDVQAAITGTPVTVGLTKVSRGTLQLSGNNLYTGTTTLNADSGTLLANTPATVAASNYVVNANSVLGGSGQINGTVTVNGLSGNLPVGGILNPGSTDPANNTGILTVNNSAANAVTFNANARFYVDINGTSAGTQYDQLRVTTPGAGGGVSINAAALLTGNTATPLITGQGIKLIDKVSAGAITGNFANAVPPSPPAKVTIGVRDYTFDYADNSGSPPLGNGNDLVLTAIASSIVWDGIDNLGFATPDNNWTDAKNWVGDVAPIAGDILVFNDVGVLNRPNPFNDFAADTPFTSITLDTTLGNYNLSGNRVLLSAVGGGITQVQGTNTVTLPLLTGTNTQTLSNSGGQLNVNGSINLGAGGALSITGTGDFDFTSTIDGGETLSETTLGTVTLASNVGLGTPLASLTSGGGGSIVLSGANVATTGTQIYNDPVTLGATVNLTGSTVTTLDTLAGGGNALTVTGNAVFGDAAADTVTGLSTLHVTGTTNINTNTITSSGTQTYDGAVTLGTSTNLTGSTVTTLDTVAGGGNGLTVTGNAVFGDAAADTVTGLSTLHVTGTTNINTNTITSSGTQTYDGAVTLGTTTNLTGSTVTTLDTVAGGGNGLTVTGNAVFGDAAADTVTGLSTLHVTGTTTINTNAITSSGTQTYDGAVTLGTTTNLTGSTVTTLDTVAGGGNGLTVTGNAVFGDAAADTVTGLSTLHVTGTTTINTNAITSSGTQTYDGAVTLGTSTNLTGSTVTTLGTVAGGGNGLTVTGNAVFGDAAADTVTGLSTLHVTGTTTINTNAITSSGTQTYDGAVTLGTTTNLTGSTVTTLDTVAGGGNGLTVTGNAVFGDAAADTVTGLSTLHVTGTTTINTNTITSSGTQTYDGAVTLGTNVGLTTTAGGNLQFNSTIGSAGNNLTLDAGATGNITLAGALSGGGTLHVINGAVQSYQAITMDNVTIDAAATSIAFNGVQNLTGNEGATSSGTINLEAKLTAAGTVIYVAGGDITINAAIDPTTVFMQSDDNVIINAAVSATTSITLIGGNDGSGTVIVSGTGSLTTTNAGSDISLTSNGTGGTDDIKLAGNISAPDLVTLSSQFGVTQTTGAVLAANLQLSGVGAFSLTSGSNDVDVLAGNVTGSVDYVDADGLTIGTVTTVGISATTGVDVSAGGDLTVNQAVDSTGGTVHLTGGAGGGNNSITLNAAVTGPSVLVNGGAGANTITVNTTGTDPITLDGLNGSDTYIVNFGLVPPIQATINISDSGASGTDQAIVNGTSNADTFDVSETQTQFAATLTVSYTTTLEQLRVNGLAGNDTFNVSPSRYATIYIDGGNPSFGDVGTPPNVDTLNFDPLGNTFSLAGNVITTNGGAPPFKTVSFQDIENLPLTPLGTTTSHYDFNASAGSSTQGGYTAVLPTRLYGTGTPGSDFGWLTTLPSGGFDRGANASSFSDLIRDGHYGGSGGAGARTFQADVGNGFYLVSVKMGDTGFARDLMQVVDADTGGVLVSNITTVVGQVAERNFVINVTDGTMDLKFSDLGGDPYWTLNGIDIRPAVLLTEGFGPQGPLTADGVTVDTFTVYGVTPNAEVSVTTTLGTITSTDIDPNVLGIQVLADGSGQASIDIQRPSGGGQAVVSLQEVTGAQTGYGLVTYVLPDTRLFDFNTTTSPTQTPSSPPTPGGYFGVLPTTLYAANVGYGWVGALPNGSFDRGGANDLLRDGQNGSTFGVAGARTFQADLPNGSYTISVNMGDANFARDQMQVTDADTNTVLLTNISSPVGQFYQNVVTVNVTDGSLNLTFSDLGGDPSWVINGLQIRPTASVASIAVTGPGGSLSADGMTTDNFSATATNGSLVTLSTSLGTITGVVDASPLYAGIQVLGTGAPINFGILRPTSAGVATVSALDVTGAASGVFYQSYVASTTQNFDFNAAASPTAAGFIGVLPTALYAANVGYGWVGALPNASFDRGGADNLLRDGQNGSTFGVAGARTFQADIPNGSYSISVTMGDASFARDQMQVTDADTNTVLLSNISSPLGQFYQNIATVNVTDGSLDLTFSDLGGDPSWVINGLQIRPLASVASIAVTGPGGSLPADGMTTDNFSATATNGSLVTLSTSLGTITGVVDASPLYAGIQVVGTGAPINFGILRPNSAGIATVSAVDVTGAASGAFSQTYTATASQNFDFNTGSSPTAAGFVGVLPTALYAASPGYGWVGSLPIGSFDRGGANAELRDGQYGSTTASGARIFQVDVPNGSYTISVTMGDGSYARDLMQIKDADTNTILLSNINAPAGQFSQNSVTVNVTDGSLDLKFSDGGGDPYWVLNSLQIRPTASVTPISVTGPGGSLPADGTTIDGFNVTAAPGSLVTLSTNLGTITGVADASPLYTGLQVVGTGAPIAFGIVRPYAAGVATVSAQDVTGAASGTFSQTYAVMATRRFDFNSSTSVTAAGFIGVRGNNLYSASTGFGWNAAASEFDRGTASATTVALYRDGAYGSSGVAGARTFQIQVTPGGTYGVRVYVGDASSSRDNIQVSVEGGGSVMVPNTAANQFQNVTLTGVDNGDGVLTVTIQDLGGDPYWVVNGMDVAAGGVGSLPGAAPLKVVALGPGGAAADPLLTTNALTPIVTEAIARWQAAGIGSKALTMLKGVNFQIVDLDSVGELGLASPGLVQLDDNGNGYGWFVDATPKTDSEFATKVGAKELKAVAGSAAFGRVDLLTVVMHELGHELGLTDVPVSANAHALMTESFTTGLRRLPPAMTIAKVKPMASGAKMPLKLDASAAIPTAPAASDAVFSAIGSPVQERSSWKALIETSTPFASSIPLRVDANLAGLQPTVAQLPGSVAPAGSSPRKISNSFDTVFDMLGR